jgi:hypothetical protein
MPGQRADLHGRVGRGRIQQQAGGQAFVGEQSVVMDSHKNLAHIASRRLKIRSWLEAALWFACLIAPLVIGLAWGAYLDDSAYVTFRYARNLAAGRGLTHNLAAEGRTLLRAPLYALALSLPAGLGIPLPQAGLVLSALGWGAAAVAIYIAGRAMRRPVAAVMSAALVVFSPAIVSTLGTEIPWALAWAWFAIAASIEKRWNVQTGALALMLCTRLDLTTLAMAALLLAIRWIESRRFPLWPSLILAIAALGWGLIAIAHQDLSPSLVIGHWTLVIGHWTLVFRQLLDESEFYWLFPPLSLCGVGGLLTMERKPWRAGLLWGVWVVTSLLSGGMAAGAMLATLGLFLAGLGVDWITRWIETHDVVRLDRFVLAVSLALIGGFPLGVAQASSLLQRYQARPVARQELEQQAGDWLRANSEPSATVLGSARVGYLADRATLPWDGGQSDQAELALLLKSLADNPPEYGVSFRSLAWDHLMRTGWFRNGYEPVQSFESPYDGTSPLIIWGRRSSAFDRGERRPVNAHLPGGVDLVGYTHWPERAQPGDEVYVTLFLQATQPVTKTFQTVVLFSLPEGGGDWMHWRQVDMYGELSVPVGWWQPGQVVAERFVLQMDDVPVGAYRLDVSVLSSDTQSPLRIYQDDDMSPLDRVLLGYVVVPWQGELDVARPVGANFGNQIDLLGFEVADRLSPGAEFDVTLYWEARRPPEDYYVVFVHLLDADGQLVASHDGPPMDGRYPTRAWLPGDVVPDVHRLVLAPDTPVGMYDLRVGMYQWPSLERLPVWDSQGVEQADRIMVLQSIQVQ